VKKKSTMMRVLVVFVWTLAGARASNFFVGTVNPPSSPFAFQLAGSAALDNFYNHFNVSGILAIGAALLALGGYKG
jgi:hypothetical protein